MPTSFTAEQQDAAKAKVCEAFNVVRKGVAVNTNASAPGGPQDLSGGIAVAANARLSLLGGGQYLLSRLDPATPEALANDSRSFANVLTDIGATAISGVPTTDPAQSDRLNNAQNLSVAIAAQCEKR